MLTNLRNNLPEDRALSLLLYALVALVVEMFPYLEPLEEQLPHLFWGVVVYIISVSLEKYGQKS